MLVLFEGCLTLGRDRSGYEISTEPRLRLKSCQGISNIQMMERIAGLFYFQVSAILIHASMNEPSGNPSAADPAVHLSSTGAGSSNVEYD